MEVGNRLPEQKVEGRPNDNFVKVYLDGDHLTDLMYGRVARMHDRLDVPGEGAYEVRYSDAVVESCAQIINGVIVVFIPEGTIPPLTIPRSQIFSEVGEPESSVEIYLGPHDGIEIGLCVELKEAWDPKLSTEQGAEDSGIMGR